MSDNLMNILLWILIAGPVVFGLAVFIAPGKILKTALVAVSSAVIAATGIYIAAVGGRSFSLGHIGDYASVAAEIAIVITVILIAVKIKSVLIGLLAAAQLALALILEFMPGRIEKTSPDFVIDKLSIILILIVSVIGSAIVFYAIGYMRKHESHAPATTGSTGRFFFFLIGFLGVMNGLVLANDLRWLSFFWEATTICSFALIGHDGTAEAKRNAKRALLINTFGGLALAIAAFYAAYKYQAMTLDAIAMQAALIPFAFLTLASLTKSAQMPFQSWLLGAMVAPTPVSALLHSATMVNAGAYLILRLSPAFAGSKMMYFIAMIGAFTFALTSALAVSQSNGKKVLAYSTIANLGLIISCAGLNSPLAYAAAVMILCFHAASKGLLFLCMGTIEQGLESRDIEDMGSMMRKMPFTTAVTVIAMVSMLAPPFGMLISKWMSIEATIQRPVILLLVVVGSAFTVLFWSKWIGRITTVSYHEEYKFEKIPFTMMFIMLALVIVVVVAGFVSIPIYTHFIEPLTNETFANLVVAPQDRLLLINAGNIITWPLFLFVGIVLTALLITYRRADAKNVSVPFLCGENIPNSPKSYQFTSIKDKPETAWLASFYLKPTFDESKITIWTNLIAIMIILSMLAVAGVV